MRRFLIVVYALCAAASYGQRAISNDEFAQQETSVAISRADQNVIVVGSNDDAMDVRSMPSYMTTDGGATWETYRIPKAPVPYHAIGDPVVIADNDGGFYYAHLLFDEATGWYNMLVSHSADGKSWMYNSPVIAEPSGAIEDKEWLAIDHSPTSPAYGRLYLTWTRLHPGDQTKSGTFISWSDDTGKTWTEAKRIGSFTGTFTLAQVGGDGTIYVSYSQYSEESDSIGHYMSVSRDFGATFSEHLVARFINYPFSLGIGRPALKGERLVSFPYLSYDIDAMTGALHAVYGSYDLDRKAAMQLYTASTDDGATWTAPRIIGDAATLDRDRFQPWVAVDEVKNIPHMIYYSSERDVKNLLTTVYHARVMNDSIVAQRMGDEFNPLDALDFTGDPFIGDYAGADLSGRTFAASWTQNRAGFKDGEIFVYVNGNIDSLTRGVTSVIKPARFMIESITPNPVRGSICKLRIVSRISATATLELLDLRGMIILSHTIRISEGMSDAELALPKLSAGSYFIKLATPMEAIVEKIVVD